MVIIKDLSDALIIFSKHGYDIGADRDIIYVSSYEDKLSEIEKDKVKALDFTWNKDEEYWYTYV